VDDTMAENREHWGSSLGFILAAAGSAVGLGNIWKFPYITGENGGGAFVIIYLLCIAAIGLPVMLCEITLGRHTQRNPVGAFLKVAPKSSTVAHLIGAAILLHAFFLFCFGHWVAGLLAVALGVMIFLFGWVVVGAMGVLAGFVILSFYSVVAGWTIGYVVEEGTGRISTLPEEQTPQVLVQIVVGKVQVPPEGLAEKLENQGLDQASMQKELKTAERKAMLDYLVKNTELSEYPADWTTMDDTLFREAATMPLLAMPQERLAEMTVQLYGGKVKNAEGQEDYPNALQTAISGTRFGNSVGNPVYSVTFHLIFMVLCIGIVALGVQKGIERYSKILMPVLFLLLIALIVRGLTLPGATKGVQFFLSPDFSKLTASSVLEALGHAFFSLSLGMGAMITYGSYVDRKSNLFTASLSIVALDTIVALLAGMAIFPAVFAMGFAPDAGPGLVFKVLPAVFQHIPFGWIWAMLFFLLLLVAALTSGISLLEVVTAYFVDELNWSRGKAAVVFGTVIAILGGLCAVNGKFFDRLDNLSSNWLLPLGGMFIALFVGWIWGTKKAVDEIRHGSHNFADVHLFSLLAGLKDDDSHNSEVHVFTLASLWGIFIRFIAPFFVLLVFLWKIGWLTLPSAAVDAPPALQQQARGPATETILES
jgi:NSS family neurotransmitter:Na+ symporter